MEGWIHQIYWSKKGSYDADERTYKIVLLSEDDVKFEDLFERNYLQTLKAVYWGRRGEIWTQRELKQNVLKKYESTC